MLIGNHLSNVLTTISDRKIGVYSNGSLTLPNDTVVSVVDYYEPHMVNATDYYAFGMPSRVASSATGAGYRFGFNGKENDNEVKGFGNQINYDKRIFDARLGRFLSVDPLTKDYPYYTPYQFAGNTPIQAVDLDGLEEYHFVLLLKRDGTTSFSLLNIKDIVSYSYKHTGTGHGRGNFQRVKHVNETQKYILHFAFERNTLVPCNGPNKPCGGFYPIPWDTKRNEEYPSLKDLIGDPNVETKLLEKRRAALQGGLYGAAAMYGGLTALAGISRLRAAESTNSSETVTYYRVQGGQPPKASRELVKVGEDGNVTFQEATLNVSIGDLEHAKYFQNLRPGSQIVKFEVPKWFDDFMKENAIPQKGYKTNPANQGGAAPKMVDPTTPGSSYELPAIWSNWLNEVVIPGSGKVIK